MNRDWPEDQEQYNRLDADLAQPDPADVNDTEDNDIERRDRITAIVDSIEPQPKERIDADVVYADTDMNPHPKDQRDVHQNDADDIV